MKTWRYAGFGLALWVGAMAGELSPTGSTAESGTATARAPPPPAAVPFVTARWRYAPPPDAVLASMQRDAAALSTSYREYRRRWRDYDRKLRHCRRLRLTAEVRAAAGCHANDQADRCRDAVLGRCLRTVLPPLDHARYAVHDRAIELEQAARRLARQTE